MSEITIHPVKNLTVVAKYDLNKEIEEIIDQLVEMIRGDPEYKRRYEGAEEVYLHTDVTLGPEPGVLTFLAYTSLSGEQIQLLDSPFRLS